VMRATSSRPRLPAFVDPRRTRRAGGSEPTGQGAPSPLVDQVVKQDSGSGLNPSRLTKWSNSNSGPTRPGPPQGSVGTSRRRRRSATFTILYQTKTSQDPVDSAGATPPYPAGRQAPPSGPGVTPGGRMGGWLYVSKDHLTQRRRGATCPMQPRS